jgi:hypothetical protein
MYHFKVYGNNKILTLSKIAIHASRSTPASVLHVGKLLFQKLTELEIAIAGGWQSKAEKALLQEFSSNCSASLMIFIAKIYAAYTLPRHLRNAFAAEKIAIIEPAMDKERVEEESVDIRDRLIEDLIGHHLFFFIHPGGRLHDKFNALINAGKEVYILNHPLNNHFFVDGARTIDSQTMDRLVF